MRGLGLGALLALLALPALAAPPVTSLRPMARPGPAPLVAVPAAVASPANPFAALGRLFAPKPRPATRVALAPDASGLVARGPGASGGICGIPGLGGTAGRSIPGRIRGCGLEDGVQITSVEGIRLTQGASMDCTTAQALHTWVTRAAVPAVGARGGGIKSIEVAAGYACRTLTSGPSTCRASRCAMARR